MMYFRGFKYHEIADRLEIPIGTVKNRIHIARKQLKDNLIAVDWHTPLSFEPMIYGFAVTKKRFSHNLIRDSRVFVVNFMPSSLAKDVLFCGRNSGRHTDKFKETGLSIEEAEKIDCCKVKEAAATLECEVIDEIETGDHIFFIGKVIKAELKKEAKRTFHVIDDEFTTTVNLAGGV